MANILLLRLGLFVGYFLLLLKHYFFSINMLFFLILIYLFYFVVVVLLILGKINWTSALHIFPFLYVLLLLHLKFCINDYPQHLLLIPIIRSLQSLQTLANIFKVQKALPQYPIAPTPQSNYPPPPLPKLNVRVKSVHIYHNIHTFPYNICNF